MAGLSAAQPLFSHPSSIGVERPTFVDFLYIDKIIEGPKLLFNLALACVQQLCVSFLTL